MRSVLSTTSALLASVQLLSLVPAALCQLKLDVNKPDTIKSAAKAVMGSLVDDYKGQKPFTPGLLPSKYNFFESGLFFNTILDYAAYTGDKSFNTLFEKDFYAQIGDNANFIPSNTSARIANDDIGYWALAAISAAEFGAKPADKNDPEYLQLADNVFNDFVKRWDAKTCKGGLRWTITPNSNGYDFKDTNSNGVFFELSARLGAQTGNKTYLDWATKVYDWTVKTGLTGSMKDNNIGQIFAGASVQDDCQQIDKTYYSAQQANYIYGCAIMYKATESDTWLKRMTEIVQYTAVTYFGPQQYVDDGTSQVVNEQACEFENKCNVDQKAGKSILFRALGTAIGYDSTYENMPVQLNNSAKAAARSCNTDGDCAFKWTELEYDPSKGTGVGEKMAAIESFLVILRHIDPKPVKDVFQSEAQTESPPATSSDSGSPPSETSPAPAEETSMKPSSATRMMAGSILGGAALVSFLQMLL